MPAEANLTDDIIQAVTTYQTPEDYLVGTVLIGILFGVLMVLMYGKKPYNDVLKAKGLTKSDMPYGLDYLAGGILCIALCGLFGFAVPGWALGLIGQPEAPAVLYYVVAAITGIIVGRYGLQLTNAICDIFRDRAKIVADAADAEASTATANTETTKRE